MDKLIVALTGATGNMLVSSIDMFMNYSPFVHLRILTRNSHTKRVRTWKKIYGDRLEVFEGDISDFSILEDFVKDASYLVNAAAIIPPHSDKNIEVSTSVNYRGTKNIVEALIKYNPSCRLIHISTVAIYGNRNFHHPFGRVGDPLLPSFFDVYGSSKLKAERTVVESVLENWVVLRQTGMLYSKILMSNISDGLMFHTPFNVPIEWVSDRDSATLIFNIVKYDIEKKCTDFWKQIYNIGGGDSMRCTGFDVFDVGFRLIGGNAEKFLKPHWMASRNFHCFWFYDSDILEEKFHFRSESFDSFWTRALKENPLVSLGKYCPRGIIKAFVFKPLLKDKNAPIYWYLHKNEARVVAVWRGEEEFKKIPREWKDFPLLVHNQNPETSEYLNYSELKNPKNAKLLSHGWNENLLSLDESEIRNASTERGLILKSKFDGNIHSLLTFVCKSCGCEFKTSAFGLLYGGYGCPSCSEGNPWVYNKIADFPFYKQVYFDSINESEKNYSFAFENGKAVFKNEVL